MTVEEPKAETPAATVANIASPAIVPANPWTGGLGNIPIVVVFHQNPSGAP